MEKAVFQTAAGEKGCGKSVVCRGPAADVDDARPVFYMAEKSSKNFSILQFSVTLAGALPDLSLIHI